MITNKITNKKYIGSRLCYVDNIEDDNYWGSSKYLNEDYLLYGKENFTKSILQSNYLTNEELLDGESDYILKYNTLAPNGYNRIVPNKFPKFYMAGSTCSDERKKKISDSLKVKTKGKPSWKKGLTYDEIYKNNPEKSNKLKKLLSEKSSNVKRHSHTQETKDKMSKAKLGKYKECKSEEHKLKIKMSNIGKHDHKGEKNPMFGSKVHCNKIWINNNINEKFVKPELFELIYFNEGYLKGRLKNKKLI